MANKICIIIPYFGPFNNYFSLWYKSAINNKDINFLIITDNKNCYGEAANIRFLKFSLLEINRLIKLKIGSGYKITKPYKLCDYKPAYGDLFNDYLNEFDFWGWSDCDLIYGHIRTFITDEILNYSDKVGYHGHLCLIRNNSFMNNLYKTNLGRIYPYKSILKCQMNFAFDEFSLGGFPKICEEKFVKTYYKRTFIDINPFKFSFFCKWHDESGNYIEEQEIKYLVYRDNKLYASINNKEVEILYSHFQGRKMTVSNNNRSIFYIIPNRFVDSVCNVNDIDRDIFFGVIKQRKKMSILTRIKKALYIFITFKVFSKYWRNYL